MLETERLIINKLTPDDLPWLIEMRTPDAVNRYLGGSAMQNAEALTKRLPFYLECHEKFGFGFCTMTLKETGEMIGTSGLQPLEDTGAELYAVDLAIPNSKLVGGFEYENVILNPTQFTMLINSVERGKYSYFKVGGN